MPRTVHDFLNHSLHARNIASLEFGMNRRSTIWENDNDRVLYDGPQGHAFSLYLSGGTGSMRLDRKGIRGRPGAICILPEGHRSDWKILSPFRFVHLYLPDNELRAAYAHIHDRDSRLLDLQEMTFVDAPNLAQPLNKVAQATIEGSRLLMDQAVAELVSALPASHIRLQSGLTPRILRRLDEWIEENFDQPIRLADLAGLADLSEYHFLRMFQCSRGVSPHHWLTTQRIERAKVLLRYKSIAEVSVSCGFANQSHLTRTFKRYTGLTPAVYRKNLIGANTKKSAGTLPESR